MSTFMYQVTGLNVLSIVYCLLSIVYCLLWSSIYQASVARQFFVYAGIHNTTDLDSGYTNVFILRKPLSSLFFNLKKDFLEETDYTIDQRRLEEEGLQVNRDTSSVPPVTA